MAIADKKYTYSWFVGLNYEQWARSLAWIQDQVMANYRAGLLTGDQVKAIWEQHEKVVQEKLDARNRTNPPKVVEKSPPGVVVGSAEITSPSDPAWYDKVAQGWGFIFGKTGEAVQNASSSIVGGSVGSYLVIGGIVLVVLKIFKK